MFARPLCCCKAPRARNASSGEASPHGGVPNLPNQQVEPGRKVRQTRACLSSQKPELKVESRTRKLQSSNSKNRSGQAWGER